MLSRRSENPANRPVDSGWRTTLLSNAPLPFWSPLLFPLGWAVESRAFGLYNERIVMLIGFNIILAVSLQLINGFSGQFSLGHAGFMAVGAYLAAYPAMNYSHNFASQASRCCSLSASESPSASPARDGRIVHPPADVARFIGHCRGILLVCF